MIGLDFKQSLQILSAWVVNFAPPKIISMQTRKEKDTMGTVEVPADKFYGAQTQRSIDNIRIAQDINKMPKEIIRAFAYLKKAAALTNKAKSVFFMVNIL